MDKNEQKFEANATRKCPICGGEFEDGLLFGDMGGLLTWAKSGFLGLKKDTTNIKAQKCKNCGYLESYAK